MILDCSEVILGQKQSHRSSVCYMACRPIYMYAFAKPADIEYPLEKALRLTEQQVR